MAYDQEKQDNDSGIKQASSWYTGPLFPYKILTALFNPMFGLLMEAILVILEESTIYWCKILVHDLYCLDVRDNLLGPWLQKVSHMGVLQQSKSLSSIFFFLFSFWLLFSFPCFELQRKGRGSFQCNGFNVCSCSLPWGAKCIICAASCCC